VYEQEDIAVLWNQTVCTDREVTAIRPDVTIKKNPPENVHTDICWQNPQAGMLCERKWKRS
jgi:hypothetical protein